MKTFGVNVQTGSGLIADTAYVGLTDAVAVNVIPIRQTTHGIAALSLDREIVKDRVVRRFDVIVQAVRADIVNAGEVAEVRVQKVGNVNQAVLDFGLLRTVSGVGVEGGRKITEVSTWNGTGFGPQPLPGVTASAPLAAVNFSEVRTERLQVTLDGVMDATTKIFVILPEAPADLELRIDGSPPVWTHPGPVRPGIGEIPTDLDWDKQGRRIVHLADAVAPLAGIPVVPGEDPGKRSFRLTLSSRVPGVLGLAVDTEEASRIGRATLAGNETSKDLDFDSEGLIQVPLTLSPPAGTAQRLVEEVHLLVTGRPAPERILEPIGPDASPLADLLADPGRAFCVRLPDTSGLGEITGVRLPLAPGAGGAEARIILWRSGAGGEPAESLADGASEPLQLAPGPAPAGGAWTTFVFPRPVPLEEDGPALWAALLVARGEVVWSLSPGGLPLRRGGPTGPWRQLPAALQAEDGDLAGLAGRARVVGLPPKGEAMPSLIIGLPGAPAEAQVELTPAPQPAAVLVRLDPPIHLPAVALALTSRALGAVTISDVDVIWQEATT
jgi:hypothetical protein